MSPRLFFGVMSVEARSSMSYRVQFWLNTVVDFVARFGVVYFLWHAMYTESDSTIIGGYTFDGMVVYYLAVILLGKLVRVRDMDSAVADDIYQGSLNRYLVFPASYFPFKYAQHLGALLPALLQFALFGLVTTLMVPIPDGMQPTWASVGMAIVAVAVGNLMHFALTFAIQAVAFWTDNVWSLEVAKRFVTSLLGGYMLPLEIFPAAMQQVLAWLPFQFFFYFPAKVLLGQITPGEWARGIILGLAWCAVFGLICRAVWKRGRYQYTGVGI